MDYCSRDCGVSSGCNFLKPISTDLVCGKVIYLKPQISLNLLFYIVFNGMAVGTIFTINRSNGFHDLVNTKRKSTYFDILLLPSIYFLNPRCTLSFVHKLSMIIHLRQYQLLAQQCNLRKSIVSRPLLTRPQLTSVSLSLCLHLAHDRAASS